MADADGSTLKRGFKPHELLKVNETKLKTVTKPKEVPETIQNQKHVRVMRGEGLVDEEESKELVSKYGQRGTVEDEPIRRSTRVRTAPQRLNL